MGEEVTAIRKANQGLAALANQSQMSRAERLDFKLHKATLKSINKARSKRFLEKICQPEMIYSSGIRFFVNIYNQKNCDKKVSAMKIGELWSSNSLEISKHLKDEYFKIYNTQDD